jgi:hypothetical protein
MSRSPTIPQEVLRARVAEAICALRADGRRPTVSHVREWLTAEYGGAGSQAILKAIVADVLAAAAEANEASGTAPPIPARLEEMAATSLQALWRTASKEAADTYEARRIAAEQEAAAAIAAQETAERLFEGLEAERDRLDLDLRSANARIRALESELAVEKARSEEQRRACDGLTADLRRREEAEALHEVQARQQLAALAARIDELAARLSSRNGAGAMEHASEQEPARQLEPSTD